MKLRLMRICIKNYAQLVVNLKSFMVLQKSIKKIIDGFPPFRTIPSVTGTPTYKIAKFLVPILKDLTFNEYIGKN